MTDVGTTAYRAFGLDVLSEVPLPELPLAEGLPPASGTFAVRRARLPDAWRDGRTGAAFSFGADAADLWWQTVGAFRVHRGGDIEVDAGAGVGDDLLAFPLLGPVLALALHLRGIFVLHASAVALPDRAGVGRPGIGLLGDKGAGKSTTAAALLAAGGRLLTDDLLAIEEPAGPVPRILPGWGQVKLAPEAERRFAGAGSVSRPQAHEAIDKARILVADRFADAAAPLARLYLLTRDATAERARIEPCGPGEALPLLLAHAYAARFGASLLSGAGAVWHFRAAAGLAGSGALARLVVPAGLDRLAEVMAVVSDDAARIDAAVGATPPQAQASEP